MELNKIQEQIFIRLSNEHNMTLDQYVNQYSVTYLGTNVKKAENLTEEAADTWITKAYIQSLNQE